MDANPSRAAARSQLESIAAPAAWASAAAGLLYGVAFVAGLALALGLAGTLGAVVHGGYDLAATLHPFTTAAPDAPNAIDPRGLLTFGLAGLALVLVGYLIVTGGAGFPRALGYLGYATGILLVLLYLGRLIVLDPNSPLVLGPAALTGFLLSPAFYIWLGVILRRLAHS